MKFLAFDPIAQEKSDKLWHTVWKVAFFASAALLIISAGAIFVGVSLFAPSQVLAALLGLSILFPMYSLRVLNYIDTKVKHYQDNAKIHGEAAKIINQIKDDTLCPGAGITKTQLKRGIAQFQLTLQQQEQLRSKWAEVKESLKKTKGITAESIDWKNSEQVKAFVGRQEEILKRKMFKNEMAKAAVYAAYLLKLTQYPLEKRRIEDFCELNPIPNDCLSTARSHGDQTTKILVKTPKHNYTAKELIGKNVQVLAEEIFELPESCITGQRRIKKMSVEVLNPANRTLNPHVTFDYFAEKAKCDRWTIIWKATATVAIVSSLALTVFAFISVSIFYSAHIAVLALISIAVIKGYVWDKSAPYVNDSTYCGKLIDQINLIEETEMPSQLEKLGVKPGIEISKLEPLFARYCIVKKEQENAASLVWLHCGHERIKIPLPLGKNKDKEVTLKDYHTANLNWNNADDLSIAKDLRGLYLLKTELIQKAARKNLDAAYLLKLMESPYETRELKKFVEISPFSSEESLIAKAMGDPTANIYAKTTAKSYTAEELFNKNTTELAREVFELPAPPPAPTPEPAPEPAPKKRFVFF